MKADIHPDYSDIKVTCSCGNEFTTRSTLGEDLAIEVCSSCHPFYTGKQKIVDSGGRVDKFRTQVRNGQVNFARNRILRLRAVCQHLLSFGDQTELTVVDRSWLIAGSVK